MTLSRHNGTPTCPTIALPTEPPNLVKLESPWKPRLSDTDGLIHERLTVAITQDILAGQLATGARLPTHRQVADELGVSIGTVTRAYANLQRQGLVKSEKGRGMFVTSRIRRSERRLDLSINTPPPIVTGRMLTDAMNKVGATMDADFFTRYMPPGGMLEHRQMLARMVEQHHGLSFEPAQIVMTNGAQQSLFLTMAAAAPGPLAIEQLTYPGALRAARQLKRELVPLPMDNEGILPQALEAALASRIPPTMLYVVPTVQNPTGAVMGIERRKTIAEIAKRSRLTIIEDDVYSVFGSANLPPIAKFAPDNVLYVSSLSKCLAPGLRVGYVAAPEHLLDDVNQWLMAAQTMATPLSGLLMAYWMSEGLVDTIAQSIRAEASRRNKMLRSLLGSWLSPMSGDALHAWLPMDTARAREIVLAASQAGITLAPPEAFMADPTLSESGLRICLGAIDDSELKNALTRLSELLTGAGTSKLKMAGIV
jgi:Transcriptional regulators containing a DNA-binding HTH domain and an aminotransferase domain (MocR family) and their eukaryotic orthologs